MKKITNILISLMFVIILVACGATKNVPHKLYGYTRTITIEQLDSIQHADKLPTLEKWKSSVFYDYEDNNKVVKMMYIKELTDTTEVIYVLMPEDSLYVITKRIGFKE